MIQEEFIGEKENAKEEGRKRIEDAEQNMVQKNKILEEIKNEKMMIKENDSLVKQLENLKKEMGVLQKT